MPRKPKLPWMPADYEAADAYAIQRLNEGNASPEQQQRALKWIIENACRTYDEPYFPDSSRDTDFALGKRHVGNEIVKMIKVNTSKLRRNQDEPTEQG